MIFGFWTVSQTKTSHLKTTVWAFYWMVFKQKKKNHTSGFMIMNLVMSCSPEHDTLARGD